MRIRSLLATSLTLLVIAGAGCGNSNNNHPADGSGSSTAPQCSDGIDNDGDGLIDFPDDPGCTSADDNSEDSLPAPQCSDGRDNDGDGKIDFPDDPGCFSPDADDETDDCPDGSNCPQCSNGKDDDGNGITDYPDDPGCSSAADNTEFTENLGACGSDVTIKILPPSGSDSGTLDGTSTTTIGSPCGGGGGAAAVAYELHLTQAKVVVASTDNGGTQADTVVDIRAAQCVDSTAEIACSDDVSTDDTASTATASLLPGTYYIFVEGKDSSQIGSYQLNVSFFAGEGTVCTDPSQCGPGLVCRIPNSGGTQEECVLPSCSDGSDNDGDGFTDFPNDPGCSDPLDDDESDNCPNGSDCPACGNGKDDDGDGKIDFPNDPSCASASGTSESCTTSEGITQIVSGFTTGDNTNAVDDTQVTCAFDVGGADLAFQLDLPPTLSLDISMAPEDFAFLDMALLDSTCSNSSTLDCELGFEIDEPALISQTNLAAGSYFLIVDGDDNAEFDVFDITVSGVIAPNGSCESPLAQSGALVCGGGSTCAGAVGSRTCQPAQCSDGIDNNGDGKIDFPDDPGCTSPDDNSEDTVCPGPLCPQCSDGKDNDGDGKIDFPADDGCASASGNSEKFCGLETDVIATINKPVIVGTLNGLVSDQVLDCGGGDPPGPDRAFEFTVPVPLESLHADTDQSTGVGDTVLAMLDAACGEPALTFNGVEACNDDDFNGITSDNLSSFDVTGVPAGSYAIVVQGFDSTQNGKFTLSISGVVAPGTKCTDVLFTEGVLTCEPGTTCTAGTCQ